MSTGLAIRLEVADALFSRIEYAIYVFVSNRTLFEQKRLLCTSQVMSGVVWYNINSTSSNLFNETIINVILTPTIGLYVMKN